MSLSFYYSEDVDIDIQKNEDGTVDIFYSVAHEGDYTLSIKFGGQPIPNGMYTFTVSTFYDVISILVYLSKTFIAEFDRSQIFLNIIFQYYSKES